ncbi:hypothetical protein D3C84_1116980 [compost metagenome]
MNRLYYRGENFHTAVEFLKVSLHRPADLISEPYPVFAEQPIKGSRGEVMHQNPAGGAANQCRYIGTVIGGRQCRLIGQAD